MVSLSPRGSPASGALLAERQWQWLRTLSSVASGLVLLVWSVFLIAWLALHWLILPHIDEWRPTIERRADSPAPMATVPATAPAAGAAPSTNPRPHG